MSEAMPEGWTEEWRVAWTIRSSGKTRMTDWSEEVPRFMSDGDWLERRIVGPPERVTARAGEQESDQ
jgi:hypothetical protein